MAPCARQFHGFVDDGHIGTAKSGETVFRPLRKGPHPIVCSDGKGTSREVRESVKWLAGAQLDSGRSG